MRFRPGILVCLLAGCATQSTREEPQTPPERVAALQQFARGARHCLGVEFLPPVAQDGSIAVAPQQPRVEPLLASRVPTQYALPIEPTRLYAARASEPPHVWTMRADDLAHQRDAMEQAALRFLDDVMGEDRRRVRREFGLPILTMQTFDSQSPGLDLRSDELRAEEEAQWMAENGTRLLRRPFQHFLRNLPIVRGFEARLENFKSDNVPLTQEYERNHRESRGWGRLSMRLHRDLGDPVEVVYGLSGVRVGTSQRHLKLAVTRELLPGLTASVRARQEYETSNWTLRADLAWELSERSSLMLTAGRDLDFMSSSTVYSWVESPLDDAFGIVLYASHIF